MSTFLAAIDAGSLSAASRKLGLPLATVSRRVPTSKPTCGRSFCSHQPAPRAHRCRQILRHRLPRHPELRRTGRARRVRRVHSAPWGTSSSPRPSSSPPACASSRRGLSQDLSRDQRPLVPHRPARRLCRGSRRCRGAHRLPAGQQPDRHADRNCPAVLCASPAYLEAHAPAPQRPQDLEAHECITFESLTSPAVWTFRLAKSELSVAIRSRLTVNTAEAAIDAAIAGLGITQVLSYQVEAALQAGTLEFDPRRSRDRTVAGQSRLFPARACCRSRPAPSSTLQRNVSGRKLKYI